MQIKRDSTWSDASIVTSTLDLAEFNAGAPHPWQAKPVDALRLR
jgi:hypothetical protein